MDGWMGLDSCLGVMIGMEGGSANVCVVSYHVM